MRRNTTCILERCNYGVPKEELKEHLNSELRGRYPIRRRGRRMEDIRMASGLDTGNGKVFDALFILIDLYKEQKGVSV